MAIVKLRDLIALPMEFVRLSGIWVVNVARFGGNYRSNWGNILVRLRTAQLSWIAPDPFANLCR